LPPSWTTLYELTKLDDDTFDQKLHDGTINPEQRHARTVSSVVSAIADVSKISRRSGAPPRGANRSAPSPRAAPAIPKI
jgi:hypothetical protein